LLRNNAVTSSTGVFLIATIATSASGFLFSADHITPGQIIGMVSLFVLGAAVLALYYQQLTGRWSAIYIVSVVTAQYLNFVVLIAQLFQKVPLLKAWAPTQTEPVVAVTQMLTLAIFVWMGVLIVVRSRGGQRHSETTFRTDRALQRS
jgi:hypothetical protein